MPKRTPEYMAAQRDRILEVALSLFADKGFHQTSTDDIARAVGCGKSAIYAHFESKRAMIQALNDREIQALEAVNPRDLTQLEKYLTDSFDSLHTPRMQQLSRVSLHLAAEGLTDSNLLAWEQSTFERYRRWLEPLVRNDPAAQGMSMREVRDAVRRLLFFWGGQAFYKMMMPGLPTTLLRRDMMAVAPAIIESARHKSPNRGRRMPGRKGASTARQSTGVRQTIKKVRGRASATRAAE